MNTENLASAFEIAAALALIWAFIRGPWQSFCIAITRQRLFELRDQLFLKAVDGHLQLGSPAHRVIRESINHEIQFCELLTWRMFLASRLVSKGGRKRQRSEVEDALDGIENSQLRHELRYLRAQAGQLLIGLMTVRSPLMLLIVLVLLPFAIVAEITRGDARRLVNEYGERVTRDIDLSGGAPT